MAKKCPNCKQEIDSSDVFCSNCGAKVDAGKEEKKTIEKSSTTSSSSSTKKVGTNGLALSGFIVSLVSSLLCCGMFNVISLVLSIVGLVQAKDYNGNGKGFAIAGIAISAVPILLWILIYLLGMVTRTGYVPNSYFDI